MHNLWWARAILSGNLGCIEKGIHSRMLSKKCTGTSFGCLFDHLSHVQIRLQWKLDMSRMLKSDWSCSCGDFCAFFQSCFSMLKAWALSQPVFKLKLTFQLRNDPFLLFIWYPWQSAYLHCDEHCCFLHFALFLINKIMSLKTVELWCPWKNTIGTYFRHFLQ